MKMGWSLIMVFSVALALSLSSGGGNSTPQGPAASAKLCDAPGPAPADSVILAQAECCRFAGGICGCVSGQVKCCNGQRNSACPCKGEHEPAEHPSVAADL
jgi:hypothetical protein